VERIDQLINGGVKIIQSDEVFSFSLDAVLLADFVQVRQRDQIVDLCAGNGAVGLFLSQKTQGQITMVEIQEKLADMARRSVSLNQLDNQIQIATMDLKDSPQKLGHDFADVVSCNPPYFVDHQQSIKNPNPYYAIARHEIKTDLATVLATSQQLLKTNGHFYMVHRPERLADIMFACQAHRLAPKRIRFVYPKAGREANMVLFEAIKNGRPNGIRILPPLVAYTDQNEYTPEVKRILHGESVTGGSPN
jgi:tRNA1(Val) A37 N6-methylase TrmN6